MTRAAKNLLPIPHGIEVSIVSELVKVKGAKGTLEHSVHPCVAVTKEGDGLRFAAAPNSDFAADAMIGTTRALLRNMFEGAGKGYEKKLVLVGVGYRAQVQGKILNLQVGFSHQIKFQIPHGISIEAPSQTEVVVRGSDKQIVGQVAAQIRAYRPPEPYKGKGIRYADEVIVQKEGKKK